VIEVLRSTAEKWSAHNAPRLGASLAYYTLLSLAPLLILIVAICGLVFAKSTAEHKVLQQAQDLAGDSGARTLKMLLDNTHHARSGIIATLAALVALLFGASGVFVELRESLNTIWEAPKKLSGLRGVLWQRLVSFGMVLTLGFLLLSSLLVSAGLGLLARFFRDMLPPHTAIVSEAANFVISVVAVAVLFALIFKFVPDVSLPWRDVGVGALVTAILFSVGRALVALYLETAGVGSTYGAAGSLVALVVWVYYSAQIFFFGAVFTRVWADRSRSYPEPLEGRAPQSRGAAAAGN
jgi:membrane protein